MVHEFLGAYRIASHLKCRNRISLALTWPAIAPINIFQLFRVLRQSSSARVHPCLNILAEPYRALQSPGQVPSQFEPQKVPGPAAALVPRSL